MTIESKGRGGSRPGSGRKLSPEKRVRLQAYVTPKTLKVLNGMSEDLEKPIGQLIEDLLYIKGDGQI